MNKWLRFVGLLAVLMAVFGIVGAQDSTNVLVWNSGEGDIAFLDPSRATDVNSIQYIQEMWPGLTRLNEITLDVEPGMATWTVSDDGLVYTFSIIPDVPWVYYDPAQGIVASTDEAGNPRYVTAADFKYGMLRSMDPRIGEYYGTVVLAPWIVGGTELTAALDGVAEDASEEDVAALVEAAAANVAINVVDDYTLEITLAKPAGFVANIFGMWMATAQPSWVIEANGDLWTEPEFVESYGPFALSEWLHGESLTIVKNTLWAGTEQIPAPQLDAVTGVMLEGSAALANYEAGLIDWVGVPAADIDRVRNDAVLGQEFRITPGSCTTYLAFNSTLAPTNDVRVRQAIAQGLNRQEIIDGIYKDGRLPAYFFARPDLAAAARQEDYPDYILPEDPVAAAALVEELKAEGVLSEMTYLTTTSETSALIAQAFQQQWLNIGLDMIQIQQQEFSVLLDTVGTVETNPALHLIGWCLDYPDANNFLYDVLHSSGYDVWGFGFRNEEFDSLVEQAQAETDQEVRRELYARAEQILVQEEIALVPLFYSVNRELTKSYVERPYGITSTPYFEFWSVNK
jgi:oligopeptide transport system substrate-binding protein